MGNQSSVPADSSSENQELVGQPVQELDNQAPFPELPEPECLVLWETLNHLPNEVNNLTAHEDLLENICNERRKLVEKLREMADYLAKTHTDVLIADRVGTGVGIASGALVIGGLIAAPFTAGLSLGLTIAGTTTGVLGGITSAGANITGYVISKQSLASLEEELKGHITNLESLYSSNSRYLLYAARFRPTLEQLAKLSEGGWQTLLTTAQNLIKFATNADNVGMRRTFNQVTDPQIKHFLQDFSQRLHLPCDPGTLDTLASVITQLKECVLSTKNAINSFLNYLARPELARLATAYTGSSIGKTTTLTANQVSEVKAAFRGTPMAMTKTARVAAGALTVTFVIIDVIHMVQICQETGETPTVQQLRKMADDLDKEI